MKNHFKKALFICSAFFCFVSSVLADSSGTFNFTGSSGSGGSLKTWNANYTWSIIGTNRYVQLTSLTSTGNPEFRIGQSTTVGAPSTQYTAIGQTLGAASVGGPDIYVLVYNVPAGIMSGKLVVFNNDPLPQTATLSPNGGAASLVEGQSFNGTATGAQAGNPYNISIVSGQGSASINSSTGAYTIIANGPGLIHYKVWISAGGGYDRSADAESNIAVAASKKVKVTIPANNGKYSITYKLYQGGVEIGSHTQAPGASAFIVVIDVGANDGPVTMKSFTNGIMTDGVVFVEDETGNVEEVIPVTITPTNDPDAPPTTIPPPNTTTPTTTTPTPGGSSGTVWSSTGGAGTDALTNATYREGVGKLLDAINTTEVPQAESQETAINNATNEGVTMAQSVMDAAADVKDNVQAAKTALGDKQPIIVAVSGSQLVYSYTLAQIGKTWTIDLSFAQTPITLMRTVIKVLFMLFMWFLYAKTLRSSQV